MNFTNHRRDPHGRDDVVEVPSFLSRPVIERPLLRYASHLTGHTLHSQEPVMRYALPLILSLASLPTAFAADTAPASQPATQITPVLDRAAIVRELSDVTEAGISKRLGPDYDFYHKGQPAEKFPEIYLAPRKDMPRGSKRWQIGEGPTRSSGDYSSSQGQMLYVPKNPAKDFGCDRVTVSEWTNGVFTESPEPPWHDKFRPDPMVAAWKEVSASPIGQPIACARGYGGWCNIGVVLHSSGFIGTSGTSTAWNNNAHITLPKEKLATSISLTNKNELALVTVHDTVTGKGQLAVIIITATGLRPDGKTHFVHEWNGEYPGLFNVGMIKGFKILGYIDLPGIDFPTSVCAVGNRNQARINARDGNAGPINQWDIRVQGDRDNFYKGSNAGLVSTAGFAVVAGKYENKVALIDLQAIFHEIREAYFTTEEQFQKTRNLGEGKLWPPTFEAYPDWKPSVVKVIDVERPTAVIASLIGDAKNPAQAVVASEDGTISAFSTGGLGIPGPVDPDKITLLGTCNVGRNPCSLTYVKGPTNAFIATVRGEREIVWFKAASTGPAVTRRLRDARLLDPVCVEQADTHGAEYTLITVADYKGEKIINYRAGTVTFATQGGARYGCGPDGKDEFECGGTMEFPGNPFVVSASNVN